ncbi:MAG: tetratricopeptide (TPR) repeat protein [Phenylobacterium sp.]|jgi:tetratricopeptide (TPR) repeat protein
MAAAHQFTPEGEEMLRELSTLLEWSEGFELIFLFTDNSFVSNLIRDRIKDIYSGHQTSLYYFEPSEPETLIVDCLDFLLSQSKDAREEGESDTTDSKRSPIWLELNQHGEQWQAEQVNLIQRINERRDGIRTRTPQPLVILMTEDFSREVYRLAPDLWSVRSDSRTLDHTLLLEVEQVGGGDLLPLDVVDGDRFADDIDDAISQHPAVIEWQRLLDKGAEGIDVFWAGYNAFNATYEAGYYSQARQVSVPLIVMANQLNQTLNNDPSTLRVLAVAFQCGGRINVAYGELLPAQISFEKSLALCRQRQQLEGNNSEVLSDISSGLDRLGDIHQQSADLTTALELFTESLELRRQRQQLLGDKPQVLRDISVSLEKLGDIYQLQSDLPQALVLFSESLALRRQLQQLLGEQAEVLSDINLALGRTGLVQQQLGNLTQAWAFYSDALTVNHQRQQLWGDQPTILEDIYSSQMSIGTVYQLQNNKNKALQYYEQSLAGLHHLREIQPDIAIVKGWIKWINGQIKQLDDNTPA